MDLPVSQAPSATTARLKALALGFLASLVFAAVTLMLKDHLRTKAQEALGGDVSVSQPYKPITDNAMRYMLFNAEAMSRPMEMRVMATSSTGESITADVKGIDASYPLYGKLQLQPDDRAQIFFNAPRKQRFGVAVDQALLDALKLTLGQEFTVGQATFVAQAIIIHDPDSGAGNVPRILVSTQGLHATKILRGREVTYYYRARMKADADLDAWKQQMEQISPGSNWQLYDWRDAIPLYPLLNMLLVLCALAATGCTIAGIWIWRRQ